MKGQWGQDCALHGRQSMCLSTTLFLWSTMCRSFPICLDLSWQLTSFLKQFANWCYYCYSSITFSFPSLPESSFPVPTECLLTPSNRSVFISPLSHQFSSCYMFFFLFYSNAGRFSLPSFKTFFRPPGFTCTDGPIDNNNHNNNNTDNVYVSFHWYYHSELIMLIGTMKD